MARALAVWRDRWWLVLPLSTLVLLAPALAHGKPYVFWDTAQYYDYGAKLSNFVAEKLVHEPPAATPPKVADTSLGHGPAEEEGTGIAFFGARSPFYSVWLYALIQTLGIWAVPLTQALAVAWLVWCVFAHTPVANRAAWTVSALALATLGGAWFTVGFVMPDAYAAVTLASVASLLAFGDRMSAVERLGVVLLLAIAATYHTSHLATAAALFLGGGLVAALLGLRSRAFWRHRAAPIASALALALGLQLAFEATARTVLGASPKRPPFAMARIIADGPGRLFLDRYCPSGVPFAVCAYRDRQFKTSNDFLWAGQPEVGVFSTLPLRERLRLIDEESRFVAAVASHYPSATLKAAIANTIEQLRLLWPAEAWIDPGFEFKDPPWRNATLLEAAPFIESCIARPGSCIPSPPEALVLSIVVLAVALAFGIIAAHVAASGRLDSPAEGEADDRHRRALVFALSVVAGLIVNAALCGALSGPATRYQSRVVWLAVIAAAVLEAARPLVVPRAFAGTWGRVRPGVASTPFQRKAGTSMKRNPLDEPLTGGPLEAPFEKEPGMPGMLAMSYEERGGGPADAELELTILMPCLNEAETIGTCVAKAQRFLAEGGTSGEVLVADNGSTDGSIEIAEGLGARVVSVTTKGYGAALAGGIAAARGKFVIMADADDSYDLYNLGAFLQELRSGRDLVMGNRFRGGIEAGAMPWLHYYLGNPVLSFVGRLLFGIPVRDFHCGLRGFRRSAIAGLELRTTGMEFASEMVVRSSLQGLSIAEVPTTLKPDGRSRAPHLKTWRDGWRHLKFLLMYSPKWLFFYPGFLLTGFGLLVSSLLTFGPVHLTPKVELDLSTFLAACLLTIMGVQLVTFGAMARYYAAVSGMLPSGPRSSYIVKWCKTDRLVQIALVLVLCGSALFVGSLLEWAKVGFGNLANPLVPRAVAAGLSIVVIGIQTAFAGFLFGIFDIPKKGLG
jgi:hypothetical protein